jgi:RNA polymerase sigma-70 factor, ECF subfamily
MALAPTAELFERYGAAVYRRCRAVLGDEASASDAVQEVFLKVHVRRAGFRGDCSPFTWLYSIATTHCLQQLRNARLRGQKLEALGREQPLPGSPPDERLRAMALLESFPLAVQEIAYLRHIDGLDLDEIAGVTGLSTKTVSRRLHEFAEGSREAAAADRKEATS